MNAWNRDFCTSTGFFALTLCYLVFICDVKWGSSSYVLNTVSPLHMNEFSSESAFVSPICKSNKVSLGTQLTQSTI